MLHAVDCYLSHFDTCRASVSKTIAKKLILIYLLGSAFALAAGATLGYFGMDLTWTQLLLFATIILPISSAASLVTDIVLIFVLFRPVSAFLNTHERDPLAATPDLARAALVRALNLPLFTVLRIELVHYPFGVTGMLIPMLLLNRYAAAGFQGPQFAFIAMLAFIMSTNHAIIEYYFVTRIMKDVIAAVRERSGVDTAGLHRQAVFVNARLKLFFIYVLVAVLPMVILAATTFNKVHNILRAHGLGSVPELFHQVLPWVAVFLVLSAFTTLVMAFILAREIVDPILVLRGSMGEVEKGDLRSRLSVTSADEFADLFSGFNNMVEGLNEREVIKDKFGKYVSGQVLADILDGDVKLGGEVKTVTVLFCDIRNYTALSERLTPAQNVALLNAYFTRMVAVIERHNGILDKYMGDAFMAVFGAPVADERHAQHAVAAARDMLTALDEFNAAAARGTAPLRIGVGVSTGEVLAGNIGSDRRMEYTVIGDTVNLAARLENLTKQTGEPILISEATHTQLNGARAHARFIGEYAIKGKELPCKVFGV